MGLKDFLNRVDEVLNDTAISDSISHATETINKSLNRGITSLEDALPADPAAAPCETSSSPEEKKPLEKLPEKNSSSSDPVQ